MRTPSDDEKLQGNTLPEVRDAWQRATLDLGGMPEIRAAAGGRLRPGNLLNALILWCLSRPEDEQRRIAAWGLRAFERLKSSDVPIDLRKISRDDFGALGGVADIPDGGTARPKVGRVHGPSPTKAKRTG